MAVEKTSAAKRPATKAKRVAKARKATTPAKAPAVMGRPSMLDAERIEVLLNAARLGTPLKTCCAFAGISNETLRKWRIRGEKALTVEKGRRNPTERKFADFVVSLDKALTEANVRAQATVHALMTQPMKGATPEQARIALDASKFFLTHRDRENYNTKVNAELTGRGGGPIEVEFSASKAWEVLQAINSGEAIDLPDEDAEAT